jgi:hypothetical protein
MSWSLVGRKESTFDLWSLIHFGLYAFVASSIEAAFNLPLWAHLIWYVVVTFCWEGFEHWASRKWPEKWSGKIEHWSNAWIGDPISNGLGTLFGLFVVYVARLP